MISSFVLSSCDTTSYCDSYGDCCDEYWYYPSWCGGYDTADFNSMVDCCACSSMGPGIEGECDTTDFSDNAGDGCDLYWYYPEWCGGYDTADFNSMVDCCACANLQPDIEDDCDTTDYTDSYGDGCDFYWYYPSMCGDLYDTADFHSMVDCCGCQYVQPDIEGECNTTDFSDSHGDG